VNADALKSSIGLEDLSLVLLYRIVYVFVSLYVCMSVCHVLHKLLSDKTYHNLQSQTPLSLTVKTDCSNFVNRPLFIVHIC